MRFAACLVAILLWFSIPASAQVAFDANASSYVSHGSGGITSLSVTTLTVGAGSHRALVAQLSGVAGTTCTWDVGGTNQAMTLIIGVTATVRAELWGLVNPTSGNKTLTCSFLSHAYVALNATSFTGVDQTGGSTTFYNTNSVSGSTTSISLPITTTSGDAAIDLVTTEDSVTLGSQTQLFNDAALTGAAASYGLAAGTSVTFTWTNAGTDPWVDVGTAIKQFASAPTAHNLNLLGVGK